MHGSVSGSRHHWVNPVMQEKRAVKGKRRGSVSWSNGRDPIPLMQKKRAAKEKRRDEARQRELEQRRHDDEKMQHEMQLNGNGNHQTRQVPQQCKGLEVLDTVLYS